jgi:hypothetical protein
MAYLEVHIAIMRTHIPGGFSEMVFNLDEMGSSDWDDRKPRKALAPVTVSAGDVFHCVSRQYRHVTLLACVSATGDALTPMIVSQTSVRDSFGSRAFGQDEDVMVRQRKPAYVDEELFHEYLTHGFIPHRANLRTTEAFSDELAILLMDSALVHVSERCLRLFSENCALAVAFPADTTNIFQILDLVFFGALNKLTMTADEEFDDDSVNNQITKLVQAYEQTAASITIRSSFRQAGMVRDTSGRPFRLRVNEESLREKPGFQKIWDRDIKIEELPRKRQAQRFGMMNAEFII